MTSETLNGIENFTSNLAFNDQNVNDLEDGGNIEDEIDSILNNPVFISALNVANYESTGDTSVPVKANDIQIEQNDTVNTKIIGSQTANLTKDSNSSTANRTIEKLRIVIPLTASPTSMHSSSSESHSPVRSKKNKKRFCIKCNLRFKHTADWLNHIQKHVSLPSIQLKKLNTDNRFYKEYLMRSAKRCRSPASDEETFRLKLKIPRDSLSQTHATHFNNDIDRVFMKSSDPSILAKTTTETATRTLTTASSSSSSSPVTSECRIRVLRAEEIKQSPPRSPLKVDLPEHAMVAVPSENRIHYECPTLDGLSQFAEDAMNEESTAQILKQLLETPHEPETNDWDSTSNEFISIDRLAHTCKTCNEKYPDLNFLHEHQRLTGHGDQNNFPPLSLLEPIQNMTVDQLQQYHPPQTNHLEHMLGQQKATPQTVGPRQPPPPMYGQPPVLPIHQMENQVRNFPSMSQMENRTRYGIPPRHMTHVPSNYGPMNRFMPPSQMMRSSNMQPNHLNHPNHPINMTPFLEMSPDMYNPQQANNNSNIPINGIGFNRSPNPIINRYMTQPTGRPELQPRPPDPNMMQRFQMPQPPQQPTMNGPLINRPLRNLPPYPLQPYPNNMGKPAQMGIQSQRPVIPPVPMSALEQQQKARFEQMIRAREIENRPFISNAPRTEGLPVIESVQSGAITLNSAKKPIESSGTIQISDQITLSVKNKDSQSVKLPEKTPTPITDTNKMKTILTNRGITVKSASKKDSSKPIDDSNKTPYASAEAAVQKLQMNNSVSIISKKKVPISPTTASASTVTATSISAPTTSTSASAIAKEGDTIDLSNDDDTPEPLSISTTPPKQRPTILKCPIKKCEMKFSNVKLLREHSLRVHQLTRMNKFKCTVCSARFPSSEIVKTHIQKMHPNQMKSKHEFGIPIVNFNDPNIRKKMLSLGFTNFLPITSIRNENSDLFGMPIININGPSINNLKNLFDADTTKIMPINAMRTIPPPRPKNLDIQSTLQSIQSQQSSQSSSSSMPKSNHPPRSVPKLISVNSSSVGHSTETSSVNRIENKL